MITIITKSYCPFCQRAKSFLDKLGKEYTEIEVSSDVNTYAKYKEISGMQTVPQIFIGKVVRENCIGGYDDMMEKYEAGKIL